MARLGMGRSFGTFGELLQGILPGGRRFLVTLPLARYATAFFRPAASGEVRVFPPHKEKARRLVEALLRDFGLPPGGLLKLTSQLPEGKGLGSSSADLVAAARAVASAYGIALSSRRLGHLMAAVEPSDGLMFPGVVSYYHREGELRRFLGPLPEMLIVAVDEGGMVDTQGFNQRSVVYSFRDQQRYRELLLRMEQAVPAGHLAAIGECATQSAVMHQRVLPKRNLDLFLELRRRFGALGVVAAHSGTYLGLLFPGDGAGRRGATAALEELGRSGLDAQHFDTHTPKMQPGDWLAGEDLGEPT